MKQPDDPSSPIVSLETHRRRRQAEDRARVKAARARPGHERAVNWRRVPLFVAVIVGFMILSWLFHAIGGLLDPFR
jgi:hypothetical protein